MKVKTHETHAIAKVIWRTEEEIGKSMPPPGSTSWAATARFVEDDEHDLFSVVLYYLANHSLREANLHFFAPALVLPRLQVGSRLFITDGPKIIADAEILEVSE